MKQHESLGPASQISIGTSDLYNSLGHYALLGFKTIGLKKEPYPWAQVTDGSRLVLLNEDGHSYLGLMYHNPDAPARVAALQAAGISVPDLNAAEGMPPMTLFEAPGGLPIGIILADTTNMYQPKDPILTDFAPEDWDDVPYPNDKLGIFGELAVPVPDLEEAIVFWEKLGFTIKRFEGPYPWAIAQDSQHAIGLHQTTEFTVTALTYFAKDMGERIQRLNAAGMETEVFAGTGGNVANQIAKTEEGTHFFLFSY